MCKNAAISGKVLNVKLRNNLMMSPPRSGKIEKKIRGYKSMIKGMEFENKISVWLQDQGFKVSKVRARSKRLGEIDLVCSKRKWAGFGEDILFVECKDKSTITGADILKFADKVRRALERKKIHSALFAYRGDMDPSAERAIRLLDDNVRNSTQFKKWPSRK